MQNSDYLKLPQMSILVFLNEEHLAEVRTIASRCL